MTTRTIQSRFLLRPGRTLNRLILGVLGRAQRRYAVTLHAYVFLSNHYHLLLSVRDARQLASFMNFLNSNLAKEICRASGWKDRVWSRRYRPILVSDEEPAQVERLRYILSHGCKEGLVARPNDWPGVHCVEPLLNQLAADGIWIDRTEESAARVRKNSVSDSASRQTETVNLSPLPCWDGWSQTEVQAAVRDIVTEIEETTKSRHREAGTRPLGVKRVLRQRPTSYPAKTKKTLAPRFHCATRRARKALQEAYSAFCEAYRSAAERLKAGKKTVVFPRGCFPPPMPFVTADFDTG